MRTFFAAAIGILVVAAALARAQSPNGNNIACSIGNNNGDSWTGAIYNNACPKDRPYCTGSGLCSECSATKDSTCDCPVNYQCVAAPYNAVRNADFCAPIPLAALNGACTTANDCGISLVVQKSGINQTAYYAVCASRINVCRYCDGYGSFFGACTQGVVPGGADKRAYGSTANIVGCSPAADAWNSNTKVLSPPLPLDPYEYERNEYYGAVDATSTSTTTTGSHVKPSHSVTPSKAPKGSKGGAGTSGAAASTGVALVAVLLAGALLH
jgi:hypothetical protein